MIPAARVEHASPGRLRLRIVGRRGQADYFEAVRSRLAQESSVREVHIDPRTGSVLLLVAASADAAALLQRAAELGLFSVTATPTRSDPDPWAPLRALGRLTEPGAAASGPLALALLAGAAVQGWRGRWASPAVTLTWYALQLLRDGKRGP
ncbi:MAG: hypothetical protein IT469_09680 [Pseudomonadales bacterium]|mgnify:CR=1 FL=1|nr:hypothetical protein [Pseudomonadales bacterium]